MRITAALKAQSVKLTTARLVLAVYFYVAMEWLFFATQPSFLGLLPWWEKLRVLAVTALPWLVWAFVLQALLFAVDPWLLERLPKGRRWRGRLAGCGPALVLTATSVLLVDNFTYTLFGLGIVRTRGVWVYAYLVAAVALFLALAHRFTAKVEAAKVDTVPRRLRSAQVAVLISCLLFLGQLVSARRGDGAAVVQRESERPLPNILLIASDGVEADRLPSYGYPRATTPVLDRLLERRALLFENALSNADNTTAATLSMLSGRHPTTHKVMNLPQVLRGEQAYLHLPGILKDLGYVTFQETIRRYADAADLNMLEAFDRANGRVPPRPRFLFLQEDLSAAFQWERLLYSEMLDRLSGRALHLLGIRSLADPFAVVTGLAHREAFGISDRERIENMVEHLASSELEEPFFAQIHLIETHCCDFRPVVRQYSAEHTWLNPSTYNDFYDDAILSSDYFLGLLLAYLKESGELAETLVVYSSDHGQNWDALRRVPFIFFFPEGEPAGRVTQTVQLLDVAPTLLDYLGVAIPDWMEGRTLLVEDLDAVRPVFSTLGVEEQDRDWGPPIWGMEEMAMTVCQRWYRLTLNTEELVTGEIAGHTRPCPEDVLPSPDEAREMIARHLEERGFRLPLRVD